LFGEFAVKGRQKHKAAAAMVFQNSIEASRALIMPWFLHANFDAGDLLDICRGNGIEFEQYLEAPIDGIIKHDIPPLWTPKGGLNETNIAVWFRVNVAAALLDYAKEYWTAATKSHDKVMRFINAHLPAAAALDSAGPIPEVSLGRSYYDEDRNAIKKTTEQYVIRDSPLVILRRHFPDKKWTLEEYPTKMPIYDRMMTILKLCSETPANSPTIGDALWFYYVAFTDLYEWYQKNDPRRDDECVLTVISNDRTALELFYPHDNRCFTGYDLPDAYHILVSIPLWDESKTPNFALAKLMQKSMPYCCARRTLVAKSDKLMQTDLGFFKLFSRIFYCMMANTYPDSKVPRIFDIARLVRIKQLCADRDKFRDIIARYTALAKQPQGMQKAFRQETDKNCHIIFTAFRLWILMMARNQRHYIKAVTNFINWGEFEDQTRNMAQIIQNVTDVFDADPFAAARKVFCKGNKNSKTTVYRYRKHDIIHTLLEVLTEGLEEDVFAEAARLVELGAPPPDPMDDISLDVKTNLLNLMIRVPREDWLTPVALCILREPEYGGASEDAIYIILQLMNIYHASGKPKDFEQQRRLLSAHDYRVVTWYFHVISTIAKIRMHPLSLDQVQSIDTSMKTIRYVLYPGQRLSAHAYDVFVTLCCNDTKTLQGSSDYGHQDITYDMERHVFLCAKSHKKTPPPSLTTISIQKRVRQQRKEFFHIPCKDNPTILINARGFRINGKMHCPKCASFHTYSKHNWSGSEDGRYRCPECIDSSMHLTCAVCGLQVKNATNTLTVVDPLALNGIHDVFQKLYFCDKHYSHAKRLAWGIPKNELFKMVSELAQKLAVKRAMRMF
jgi:hypothetical protein